MRVSRRESYQKKLASRYCSNCIDMDKIKGPQQIYQSAGASSIRIEHYLYAFALLIFIQFSIFAVFIFFSRNCNAHCNGSTVRAAFRLLIYVESISAFSAGKYHIKISLSYPRTFFLVVSPYDTIQNTNSERGILFF